MSVTSLMPPGKHTIRVNVEFPKGNKLPERLFSINIDNPLWGKAPPDTDAEAYKAAHPKARVAVLQQNMPAKVLGVDKYTGTMDAYLHAPHRVADRSADRSPRFAEPTIGVGHHGPERRMLIRFDLANVPKEAKLKKALLKLRVQHGNALDIVAYRVLADWDDRGAEPKGRRQPRVGAVCWSARTLPDTPWGSPGCSMPGVDRTTRGIPAFCREAITKGKKNVGKAWMYWDVSDLAKDWIADPKSNRGVLLQSRGGGVTYFRASEFEDPVFRPRMIVVFE